MTYDGSTWTPPVAITHSNNSLTSVSARAPLPASPSASALTHSAITATSWSGPTYDGLGSASSVSCPAANVCVAVSQYGQSAMYDGSSWTAATSIDKTSMTSVSCPTTTFCIAVDESGQALTFDGSKLDGTRLRRTWSPAHVGPCPQVTFCTAITKKGQAVTFDGTELDGTHQDRPAWFLDIGRMPLAKVLRRSRSQRVCDDLHGVGPPQADPNRLCGSARPELAEGGGAVLVDQEMTAAR